MKAIYKGVLARITSDTGDGVILDGEMFVDYGDMSLIIDPTDAQVAASEAGEEIPVEQAELDDIREIFAELRTIKPEQRPTIDEADATYPQVRRASIQRRNA